MGDRGAFYDAGAETMARADLEALQEARLAELLPHAYAGSPLVREAWDAAGVRPQDVTGLDDLAAKVPFLDKDSLRRFRDDRGDPYGGMLAVDPTELTAIMSTSGTTGDPTLVPEVWGGERPG